jgi:hypothetical protein
MRIQYGSDFFHWFTATAFVGVSLCILGGVDAFSAFKLALEGMDSVV